MGGWSLLGTSGNEAIVQDARRVLWFGIPVGKTATWSEPPERILALDLQGGERVLTTAQNLYGLGDVVPGASVATADWFSAEGTEAVAAIALATGDRTALSLLGDRERSDFAAAAPDGSAVAYCLRDEGPCYLDRGDGRQAMPTLKAAGWVVTAAGPRLVGQEGGEIVALAPDGSEVRGRLKERLYEVVGAHAGGIDVTLRDDDGCAWSTLDAATLKPSATVRLPSCPWHARTHPDGGFVAIAEASAGGSDVPGDPEVVRWVPGGDAWQVLTSGPYREEFPHVLDDGRIVFNRRLEPAPKVYDTKVYRRIVCATDAG